MEMMAVSESGTRQILICTIGGKHQSSRVHSECPWVLVTYTRLTGGGRRLRTVCQEQMEKEGASCTTGQAGRNGLSRSAGLKRQPTLSSIMGSWAWASKLEMLEVFCCFGSTFVRLFGAVRQYLYLWEVRFVCPIMWHLILSNSKQFSWNL